MERELATQRSGEVKAATADGAELAWSSYDGAEPA
jgi:hypothetical protein